VNNVNFSYTYTIYTNNIKVTHLSSDNRCIIELLCTLHIIHIILLRGYIVLYVQDSIQIKLKYLNSRKTVINIFSDFYAYFTTKQYWQVSEFHFKCTQPLINIKFN